MAEPAGPPTLVGLGELPDHADVVVIGAGVSGLACAARLRELSPGLSVVVLEADTKVGGRAATVEVGGYHADIGAGWIHGIEGNPLLVDGVLEPADMVPCTVGNIWTAGPAEGDSSNFHPSAEETEVWRRRLASLSEAVERAGGGAVDIVGELRRGASGWSASDERLLRGFELWLGAPASELLAGEWDPDARLGDFPGPHAVLKKGMPTVAHRLRDRCGAACRLALGAAVEGLEEGAEGVLLRLAGGRELRCRRAVCTLSLGCLQRPGGLLASLSPPLPDAFGAALGRLRMSSYCKCIMVLGEDVVGSLPTWQWTDHAMFPLAFNYFAVLGKPVVACCAINAADKALDDEAVLAEALAALRLQRPQVLAFHITRWHDMPWACGSYSFSPVGCDTCEIDVVLDAVKGRRVLFAGEHLHEEHQGALHGAYLSGRAVAEELAEALREAA